MTTLEYPPSPGGVGESVRRIAHSFAAQGWEVHVVVFHTRQVKEVTLDGGQRGLDQERDGEVYVYRNRAVVRSDENALPEFLSDIAVALRTLHNQIGFDVFHAFFLNETAFVTTLVACELGRPVIVSVRGADMHKNIFNGRQYTHAIWTLENANWVTFVSRELERRAHILVPSVRGRTSAFWNSIAPVDFGSLEKPVISGEPLSGLVVGAVGRFRDKKGLDFLIEACAKLACEVELTLLLVGDFVEKEQLYWQQFVQKSPIASRIRVTGILPRQQALAYYPLMDIFAVPSVRDGCPNSMLEAMLAARPIVGSRVDAIGEIIEDGIDGCLVAPASSAELADALSRLAANAVLGRRLGEAARKKVLDLLSPEKERANWLRVYEQVLTINPVTGLPGRIRAAGLD